MTSLVRRVVGIARHRWTTCLLALWFARRPRRVRPSLISYDSRAGRLTFVDSAAETTLDKDPIPTVPKLNFTQQPMASALKAGLPPTPTSTGPRPTSTAAPLPAIRYAAAAAAAVAPAVPPATQQASAPTPVATISISPVAPVDASPVLKSAAPSESSAPAPSPTPMPASSPPGIPAQPVAESSTGPAKPPVDLQSPSSRHEQAQPLQQQQQQQPSQESRPTSRGEGARLPNALADLVSSFENAKQRCPSFRSRFIVSFITLADVHLSPCALAASQLAGNIDEMHSALDASFQALPHPQDAEK